MNTGPVFILLHLLSTAISNCSLHSRIAFIKPLKCPSQVPKRIYTLEELRLNKIEAERFLSPADETLNTVRTVLQVIPGHLFG